MDSKRRSILVMDANQRSALAVVRGLAKQHPGILLYTADCTSGSLAGSSKHSAGYLCYPSPEHEPTQFLGWVAENCLNGQFDLVMPTTEITSQLLLLHTEQLENLPLAFADHETVLKLADKSELVRSAIQAGVPVPDSQFYRNARELDVNTVQYPCVVKPSLSKIFTGKQWVTTKVRVLHSKPEFLKALEQDAYLHSSAFMVQAFIPGTGAGLFALYKHGVPVQFFAHQRLREKPPEGGVSVLSQAAELDPVLVEHTKKLLGSVHWHGVAMVEFRIAKDGTAYLMEVNTRFWGSLQLAIDSGVNFPAQLVAAHFNEPIEVSNHYNVNQRLRWLMGDIDGLYIYLKRNHPLQRKLVRILQFLQPRLRNQKHEINRLNDFKPFLFELKRYFAAK